MGKKLNISALMAIGVLSQNGYSEEKIDISNVTKCLNQSIGDYQRVSRLDVKNCLKKNTAREAQYLNKARYSMPVGPYEDGEEPGPKPFTPMF